MTIQTRFPKLNDSPMIYELIQNAPPLDLNSRYLYILQATHFRNSCIVAELISDKKGEAPLLAGFLSGYRLPEDPRTFFVWQVAVGSSARGMGVAKRMALDLLRRPALSDLTEIITTITPSNGASLKLFESLARKLETQIVEEDGFDAGLFGGDAHESECLYRIGPFDLSRLSLS
ncbi:MAG: diaminobutyrate acetyltransferase [Desulfuromonadaceae bacterium]|nr:diaminobutyrate acetyltransferase [Desulfuromonadaceae bacterium]